MKKELFNGKRLKVARIYRGKTIDQVSKNRAAAVGNYLRTAGKIGRAHV